MSAPIRTESGIESIVRIRHIATDELAQAWSLCGLPRLNRPPMFNPGDELCVVCATEYERIRGFRFEDRAR